MPVSTESTSQHQFPCRKCGANLTFAPGTSSLVCPYCGEDNAIAPDVKAVIQKLDFRQQLAALANAEPEHEVLTVKCTCCAAESTLPPNVTAGVCPFCGTAIVATGVSKRAIKPASLLPFKVKREEAMQAFRTWLSSLWFAPSGLFRAAESNGVKGVYIPAWTYDSNTLTDYSGERGDDYQETETYTSYENGQSVTKTRTVTKTRWYPVSGRVFDQFHDILILASESLPRKYADRLAPWDMENMTGYTDEYLSGFVAESYQIDLAGGFDRAREVMDPTIRQTICRDIGGDHQRIGSTNTAYNDIKFEHLLLPVWISAYRYLEKTFHFLVNARTGEVQGERPWSVWKFVLLIVIIVAVIGIIGLLANMKH